MSHKPRISFITVVPSPYQRDLFAALAKRGDVDLDVHYMEAEAPDSPWPVTPLRAFERVMPGFWLRFQNARWHFNWDLPDLSSSDVIVLSSFSSTTGQLLLRRSALHSRVVFWGERLRQQPPGWRRLLQGALIAPMKTIAGIVGIGRAATEDYSRRFPGIHHHCIPYYCDLSSFTEIARERAPDDAVTFLFCGQMIERKGVDYLLQAFERVVNKGADVRLILVGREAELPSFLSSIGPAARARIIYEGFQPPEDLPRFFSLCDVFVLPSRHDGWGVVINQALGAGLPVITSDAAGAGLDLVEDGVNGRRFAAGDVDELERCMEELGTDPAKAARWGEASRRKALDISPEAGAQRWVNVVNSLAGRP